MTGLKSGIFHTPFRTPFASRLIHICVDLQEIRTSDAHPQIPQEPCGRKDTEAFAHLRGQPQNPQEGRAACTKPKRTQSPTAQCRGAFLTGARVSPGAPAAPRAVGKGGAAKRASPAACGGARDAAPATTQPPLPLPPPAATWAACTKPKENTSPTAQCRGAFLLFCPVFLLQQMNPSPAAG